MKTKSVKSINLSQSVIQTTNDIVKAHGGDMQIISEPGSTVFSLRLNQK